MHANKAQKAARYPAIRAFGDDLSCSSEAAVMDSEITDVTVSPIEVPSCAQVLNTAPPRACVFVGNTAEMMSRPTVKRTLVHTSWKICIVVSMRVFSRRRWDWWAVAMTRDSYLYRVVSFTYLCGESHVPIWILRVDESHEKR